MTTESTTAEAVSTLPVSASPPPSLPIRSSTPGELLAIAVARGDGIDKLEKLMELQERWEKNEARKAFVAAMAEFKKNAPVITKDKRVGYDTSKGRTEYDHATIGNAAEKIIERLAQHGFSHGWKVKQAEGWITVRCILTHAIGHSEEVELSGMPDDSGGKNKIQAVASTVTYLERYTLFAVTGLAPKDAVKDDDGRGADDDSWKLPESDFVDYKSAIEALVDRSAGESLWKSIVARINGLRGKHATGDLESYQTLKDLIAAKFKEIDKNAAKEARATASGKKE